MDAKRWSPLWVFVGGCLTGAALIGLHALGTPEPASNSQPAGGWSDLALWRLSAGSAEERVHADSAAADVATAARHQESASSASDATNPTVASQTDASDPASVEGGNSVAEVLARLETEYRQRSAPAQAPAEALTRRDESARALPNEQPREPASVQQQAAVSDASGSKAPASEQRAVVRTAAPDPETPSSDVRLATSAADRMPTPSAAEEAARLASIRDDQSQALERGQRQLAQMQELAALQQITLVEQFTLLQLQLLSLSPAPQSNAPTQSRRRARGGRIVAALPSSISDTDNPWGFELQPSVLVR